MKKKKINFTEGISYLAAPGTHAELVAVSYLRGHKGRLAMGAREVHLRGLESLLASLTPAEAKRYREILQSVRLAETLKADVD